MTTFPAIEPHSRQYTLGGEPITSLAGLRFRLGSDPVEIGLTLGWTSLRPAEAEQIRAHHAGQRGHVRPFDLPAEAWRDHATVYEVLPAGQLWRYVQGSPPQFTPAGAGLVDASITLVSDLP